jgi:hypothetical protein
MKLKIKEGTTSKLVKIFVQDSSATDGSGLTGLVYNTASLTAYYLPEGDASATAITLATATVGTYTSGGFKEVDSTNMPGVYELGLPDAVIDATSEGSVIVMLKGAANMAPVLLEVELDAIDYQDSVRAGLTALPNAAADAAGGLPISDAGALDLDATVGALTFTVAGEVDANVISVSGDATAADNLELQYDGTGITGDNYPATQSQLGAIAVAGAAVNQVAESYVLTTGVQSSGTFADTQTLDGTNHEHTDTAGTIDLYYEFDIGNDGLPTTCKFVGYVNGNNDSLNVYAYNWSGASWTQIGTISGQTGTTNETDTFDLFTSNVGTGSDAGKVRIRFQNTGLTSATLAVDQLIASYTQSISGIPNGTTVTLTSSTTDTNLIGRGWSLLLGGQDISGSYIFQAISVTGTATCSNGSGWVFQECNLVGTTLSAFGFTETCIFQGTITFTSTSGVTADAMTMLEGASGVAGTGKPHFDLSGVTKETSLSFRRWSGGIELTLTSDCTVSVDGVSGGNVTINGTGGSVNVRGMFESIVDNSGSAVSIDTDALVNKVEIRSEMDSNSTQLAAIVADTGELQTDWTDGGRLDVILDAVLVDTGTTIPGLISGLNDPTAATIADAVWDEAVAAHNVGGSFGQFVRQIKEGLISVESSVNDLSATTLSFVTNLTEASDSHYSDLMISFISGNLTGQSRVITDYNGTTKTVTVDEAWSEAPADGDEFIILTIHAHSVTQISEGVRAEMDANSTQLAAIILDTAEIGTAGAGLTAVPWNASWDAEVQSEVDDALVARGLHYVVNTALPTGWATDVTADSALDYMADDGTNVFTRSTDSLQALRDRGDSGAWAGAAGTSPWDALLSDYTTAGTFGARWQEGDRYSNTDAQIKYITRGDSYDDLANSKLEWAVTKDFTSGWTGTFTIRHRTTDSVLATASVTVADATTLKVTLTTSDTAFALLTSDDEFGPHPYDVEMVSGSNEQTIVTGVAVISKDRTTA